MYKRILMAYDGTAEGKAGLLACAEIAGFAQCETHLLAVANVPASVVLVSEGYVPDDLLDHEEVRMRKVLDEGVASLAARGFKATGHLAVGEPVDEIARVARELNCDLIVLGHRQEQSFAKRWWRGSVGASLLDFAPCSVLIAVSRAEKR